MFLVPAVGTVTLILIVILVLILLGGVGWGGRRRGPYNDGL